MLGFQRIKVKWIMKANWTDNPTEVLKWEWLHPRVTPKSYTSRGLCYSYLWKTEGHISMAAVLVVCFFCCCCFLHSNHRLREVRDNQLETALPLQSFIWNAEETGGGLHVVVSFKATTNITPMLAFIHTQSLFLLWCQKTITKKFFDVVD